MKYLLAAILLLSVSGAAQEQTHSFHKITLQVIAHASLRAADASQTCVVLVRGGREDFLPTQSCAGVIAFSAALVPVEIGTRYLLHRLRWHRLEPINTAIYSAFAVRGIEYSSTSSFTKEIPPGVVLDRPPHPTRH